MGRLNHKRLAKWFEQLADALDAGMSPENAVALASTGVKGFADDLQASLAAGKSWDLALTECELGLSTAERAILSAASAGATLPRALRGLAEARRDLAATRRRMVMAILYPSFVLHMAAGVFALQHLLDGRVDRFLVAGLLVLVPFWALVVFLSVLARFAPQGFKSLLRFLPLFSGYRYLWDLGTLCRVLAESLRAGMPLNRAWEAAELAADHPRLAPVGEAAQRAIVAGSPVSDALETEARRLPKGFVGLYRSGETTGALVENLSGAAKNYIGDAKGRLLIASMVYPKILLLGVVGYVAYRIILFYSGYFETLSNYEM